MGLGLGSQAWFAEGFTGVAVMRSQGYHYKSPKSKKHEKTRSPVYMHDKPEDEDVKLTMRKSGTDNYGITNTQPRSAKSLIAKKNRCQIEA